jgi:NAD(P) transhydrogenase subunit alpha
MRIVSVTTWAACAAVFLIWLGFASGTLADAPASSKKSDVAVSSDSESPSNGDTAGNGTTNALIASLTIFVLAIFVGFEVITKVPPTLHTPLMSGSNAISGITLVGALVSAGAEETGLATILGTIAVVMAMLNVVGGFLVTHRMLGMFRKK